MKDAFLSDVEEIRRRARAHIETGAVTGGYQADRDTVVRLLNEALATEIVCVLRYKRHYYMAQGIHSRPVAEEFLEHATEEQRHADLLAERITELGGAPDLNPGGLLSKSHSEYIEGKTLLDMIREDLIAERIAIDSYSEMVRYFGERDPTSRRLMEKILAKEEEHAKDLADMLAALSPLEKRDEKEEMRETPSAEEVPRDVGYGPSHGYDVTHGGPTGPGDAPARGGAPKRPRAH